MPDSHLHPGPEGKPVANRGKSATRQLATKAASWWGSPPLLGLTAACGAGSAAEGCEGAVGTNHHGVLCQTSIRGPLGPLWPNKVTPPSNGVEALHGGAWAQRVVCVRRIAPEKEGIAEQRQASGK